jgi:Zn-dependent protease
MLGFSDIIMTLQTLLAAALHELGHIFVIILLNKDFSLPKAVMTGLRIKTDTPLSYKDEALVCLGGPMINLLFALLFCGCANEFAVINLATALSNLIPLPEQDGYRILYDILVWKGDYEKAEFRIRRIALIFSSIALFLSLFLILKLNGGYWIFSIFFFVTIKEILFFQNKSKNENK